MIAEIINAVPMGWWIAIGTFIGGLILKAYDKWLNRDTSNRNVAKSYREEIAELNARIDKLEEDVNKWRMSTFSAQEEVARVRAYVISHGLEIPNKPDKTSE